MIFRSPLLPEVSRPGLARVGRQSLLSEIFAEERRRDDWIRTSDSTAPSRVLYQAELHPDRVQLGRVLLRLFVSLVKRNRVKEKGNDDSR